MSPNTLQHLEPAALHETSTCPILYHFHLVWRDGSEILRVYKGWIYYTRSAYRGHPTPSIPVPAISSAHISACTPGQKTQPSCSPSPRAFLEGHSRKISAVYVAIVSFTCAVIVYMQYLAFLTLSSLAAPVVALVNLPTHSLTIYVYWSQYPLSQVVVKAHCNYSSG